MDWTPIGECREKLGLGRLPRVAAIGLSAVLLVALGFLALNAFAPAAPPDVQVTPAATDAAEDGSQEQSRTVFVHVTGAVASPGLVELEEGSRVADALQAAGGLSEGADGSSVNLARVVVDGEQIAVASQGQGGSAAGAAGAAGTAGAGQATGAAGGKVSINTATAEQLQALPGIGEATASKIVADREAKGPFTTCEDLMRVSGIGERKYEGLADLICL